MIKEFQQSQTYVFFYETSSVFSCYLIKSNMIGSKNFFQQLSVDKNNI